MSVLLQQYQSDLAALTAAYEAAVDALQSAVNEAKTAAAQAQQLYDVQYMYMTNHMNFANANGAALQMRPYEFWRDYAGYESGQYFGGSYNNFQFSGNDVYNTAQTLSAAAKSLDAAKKAILTAEADVLAQVDVLNVEYNAAKLIIEAKIAAFEQAYLTGVAAGLTDEQAAEAAAEAAAAAAAAAQAAEADRVFKRRLLIGGAVVAGLILLYFGYQFVKRSKNGN